MAKAPLRSIATLFLGIAVVCAPARLIASEFRILLNKVSVSAPERKITIGDVATVTGGSPSERDRISGLDLETFSGSAEVCQITRRQIEFRVLVDGYAKSRFQVIGPDEVAVRCSTAKELREKLEELFTNEICRQFGLDKDDVAVRLVNEQQIKTAETKLVSDDFSATVLFQPQLPIGKTQIQVEFGQPSGNRFLEPFDSQVIISMDIALATQGIPKGTVVDRDMIRVIKRPVLSKENFAEPAQAIGRVAKRDIASNEVVLSSAVASLPTNRTPIVKRNDVLDVIVKLGQNEIRLKNAKAMSQGNVGETIVVLNTRSNKQFSATVVDRNLAKISPLIGVR